MVLTSETTPQEGITSPIATQIDAGVATILLDQPNARVNTIDLAFIDALDRAISSLPPDLEGVIVASSKEGQFVAGADLRQLLRADADEAMEVARHMQRVLNRLEALPYPSVAAINGPALGGGLELALACDYRVAAQSSANVLGLPEVSLGLLPAGGGTQRLPRLIGLGRALGLILEGKRFNTRRARKYGVIDEEVHPAVLLEAARSRLRHGKRTGRPRWSRLDQAAERWRPLRLVMYRQAERAVRARTHGHYPAPLKALDCVRAGQEQGFGAGLAAEAVAFGELTSSPVAHHLIDIFFATEGLKREQQPWLREAPAITDVGVVGAGFMGAGIAQAAAVGGARVRLRDVTPEAVARGLKTAAGLTMEAARKGRFSRTEANAIVSRLSGTTDFSGFRRAQLVIEAVFEDRDVKRGVIAELEGVLGPEAVIASNTSSLPIAGLAEGAKHPDRVLGIHFFSPVHKMPLLEIVRWDGTADAAVATALAEGKAMGKTMIVVRDGPGFYTTRVLAFMLQEAGLLFEEGASIDSIDRALTAFGFPTGPLALIDEVGIDVAAHIREVLSAAFPGRFPETASMGRMVAAGRLGRKSGKGFYDYTGRRKKPDPSVYALRHGPPVKLPRQLMQRRMVLAFVNEAARCLEEGIIASPRDGDVGGIMGIGFPPFLGGPFRYVDDTGAARIVAWLDQCAYAYGPRFEAAPLLRRMAESGGSFYGETE